MKKPVFVTQPCMPPLTEFIPYLEKIWASKILTNAGPFHQKLEQELCDFLGVKYISLFSNATIGLITALKALKIQGEVITTPYSFVATAHSIMWSGLKPVFVDINPETLNLDSNKIAQAITKKTSAIMPVHCYGKPCDVDAIQKIADKYGLKIIYDAAHAFGVDCHCGSILNHGDLSVISFHATKVFNTFEGGAIVSPSLELKNKIDQFKNFGFVDEITVDSIGINGKLSEVNSAYGLLQLKYYNDSRHKRREIDTMYRDALSGVKGIKCLNGDFGESSNFSYFPILVKDDFGLTRDDLFLKFKSNNIYARRYFYPLISEFPMYRNMPSSKVNNLPVATKSAQQILCLPIYPDLSNYDVSLIISLILES